MGWVNAPGTYWVNWLTFDVEVSAINSIYLQKDDGVTSPSHALLVAGTMHQWWKDNLAPLLSNEWRLQSTAATDMATETSFTRTVFTIGGFPGSMGPELPAVCGKRIWFETGLEGRSFRGHNTVPGVPKEFQLRNTLDVDWVNQLEQAYELIPAVAASLGCTWVVCSRHTGGVDRATALNTPVSLVIAKTILVDYWEQRKPGAHTTSSP